MPEAYKYTAHEVAQAVELYKETLSVSEVVRKFGSSHVAWGRRLRLAGVEVKRHKPLRTKEIVAMRDRGETFSAIAERFGFSRQRAQQIYIAEKNRTPTERQQRRMRAMQMYADGIPLDIIAKECGFRTRRAVAVMASRWAVRRSKGSDRADAGD